MKKDSTSPKFQRRRCGKCGYQHQMTNRCPAEGKQCNKCNRFGHFAKCCRDSRAGVSVVSRKEEIEDESSIAWFTVNIIGGDETTSSEWNCRLKINEKYITFKIDTGADVNVMPWKYIKTLEQRGLCKIIPTAKHLKSYSNSYIPVKGLVKLNIDYNNQQHCLEFFVVELEALPILGIPGIKVLGLLERVNLIHINGTKIEAPEELFQDNPGKLKGEYTIKLRDGALPKVQSPRKFPFAVYNKLSEELKRLQNLCLIEPVTEPTAWVQQMAVVVKKDGSLRICLDPRELNKVILREQYALPSAEEIFSQMHGAKFFSFLDATQGFHHIKLSSESTLLTTFNTPFGRFEWLRLPYGLVCSSEVFHRRMMECLQGLEGVAVFIDDIAVWGRSKEEHDLRLKKLLEQCHKEGIHLNRKNVVSV